MFTVNCVSIFYIADRTATEHLLLKYRLDLNHCYKAQIVPGLHQILDKSLCHFHQASDAGLSSGRELGHLWKYWDISSAITILLIEALSPVSLLGLCPDDQDDGDQDNHDHCVSLSSQLMSLVTADWAPAAALFISSLSHYHHHMGTRGG